MSDSAPEHDVNTDAGFLAALASKTGTEVTPEMLATANVQDTSIEAGLEIPGESRAEQPRDDETGQYVAQATVAAPPVVATATHGGAPTAGDDDPLAEFLAQHGNDPMAAAAALLKERDGQTSLIGRHAQEVGDVRKENAELRERLARVEGRLESTPIAPAAQPVPPNLLADIEATIADPEKGGDYTMRYVLANYPQLVDQTLDIWFEYDVRGARAFERSWNAYQAEEQAATAGDTTPAGAQQQPSATDLYVQRQMLRDEVSSALEASRSGIDEALWTKLRPIVSEELDAAPKFIKDAVLKPESTPEDRVSGMKTVVQLAQARLVREATEAAARGAASTANAAKSAVTVVSSGHRPPQAVPVPVGGGEDPEAASAARIAEFRKQLLEAPTTSIEEGLTYERR